MCQARGAFILIKLNIGISRHASTKHSPLIPPGRSRMLKLVPSQPASERPCIEPAKYVLSTRPKNTKLNYISMITI